MRLVYFGTSEFAVPALEKLAKSVILVVTQPDKPSGRGLKLHESPVKQCAKKLGLETVTPEKCKDEEFVAFIERAKADALCVAAYGQILPEALLNSARFGGINLHASLLPKYRGAAPIQWAILQGERKTGVTLVQMDKGMDTGDTIAKAETEIGAEETAGELGNRLAVLAGELSEKWMPVICSGSYPRVPQDNSKAVLAPKLHREQGYIPFNEDWEDAHRKYRAFTPKPSAWLITPHGKLIITKARKGSFSDGELGIIKQRAPEGIEVQFKQGTMWLLEVKPEGKRIQTAHDFMNGFRLNVGDSLK
jgi:methionyl-tRNA formyltransferase